MTLSMALDGKLLAMLDDVSELELGPISDALDVGIVVLDGQGCIVGWNDWIARASRHSERSVLGKNLFDVFPNLRDTRLPAVLEESIPGRELKHPDAFAQHAAAVAGRSRPRAAAQHRGPAARIRTGHSLPAADQ